MLAPLLAVVLLFGGSARAAPFEPGDTSWEGGSELLSVARTRLGTTRVELVATLDWSELTPADGLLVMHPKTELDYTEASAFMRAGGRVALLDDFGKGTALLERFQIRRQRAPLRPARSLRQNPNYAIATPSVQQVAGQEQGRHPVVAQVDDVVTNHPTGLEHPNLTPVLDIAALGEPNVTLAVTGVIAGRGRLFVMGDPSVLINLMMRYPGNRAFGDGLVAYLVEDDTWGKREGRLFIVTGSFRQRGSFGGGTGLGREIRDHLEGFSEAIADMHDDGLPDLVAILLGVFAALGGVAWTVLNSTRTYRRVLPRYASPQPLEGQGGVAGRAAVLAAPTTHRALPLLELKSALEEGLAHRLGRPAGTPLDGLIEEIDRQNALSRPSSHGLKVIAAEMKKAESAVIMGRPIRVTEARIEQIRDQVLQLLRELEQREDA